MFEMTRFKWFLLIDVTLVLALVAMVVQPTLAGLASYVPVNGADPARLQAHVKKLSVDFYPRSFDQPANLARTADYISAELKAAGAAVSLQEVLVEGVRFHNVIGRYGPQSGPVMVIGAHYDSHASASKAPAAKLFSPETHTPGADDNASGVAGLLELARMLGSKPPAQAIELVAYTLEEPPYFRSPHMGSAWHARALKKARREVRLMLSLEMIGYFTDLPSSQKYPLGLMKTVYPERGNFIALVGRFGDFSATRRAKQLMIAGAGSLPVFSINAPAKVTGVDFSDHLNYWKEGYPALMVTDTSFMRYEHYHGAGDTVDKLNYARMADVVNGVASVVRGF